MESGKSIKKNYFYNLLLQLSSIFVPLILTPYVSRVLGAESIGEISYTQSIINYLIIFGNMGTGIFALRQIAYYRDDYEKQRTFFSTMLCLRLFMYVPMFILFFLLVFLYESYSITIFVGGTYLLAEAISVEWYFSGNENFKITVVRSLSIKLLGFLLVFLFVKESADKYVYVLILGGLALIGAITLLMIALKQNHGLVRPEISQMKNYLIGGIILLIPQIASSIYVYFDKIMIGILSSGVVENGYYEQTQKIIRLSITIVTALPTVMLPRISSAYSQHHSEEIEAYMIKSMKFSLLMAFPIMVGVISIADNLVPWFFGAGYDKVILLLKIQGPIILFNSFHNIIGYQYFLATKQERRFTLTILAGTIPNLILNFILIPRFDSIGASIASVFAEILIALVQLAIISKIMNLLPILKYAFKVVVASAVMLLVLCVVGDYVEPGMAPTFILILVGSSVYFGIQLIFKDELLLPIVQNVKGVIVRWKEKGQ